MNASYVNEWLDEYNDYMRLYRMFGDQAFMDRAKAALDHLQMRMNREKQLQRFMYRMMNSKSLAN
ncbi:hypothetical protein [Paenibacillus harenae]|uniref:Vacuolar-type H+-ATPase catalytic subunit A/Vma1 n=1 Tax=Paenibacillus harenae TaxID=306543 RepID=A0ABT9U9M7_PAEHA|nr:hypothetical protein [Paenibacillus harenae]MDQ0063878.1 vacuolar-type H+-ATPase catalytic subunit A/Vma1 [Paenibacillus harenae]MDQ0116341.1 vacuolar-type H+-ATPase catalytic subunit A/Vma1 [Paenibacillus harenae]